MNSSADPKKKLVSLFSKQDLLILTNWCHLFSMELLIYSFNVLGQLVVLIF